MFVLHNAHRLRLSLLILDTKHYWKLTNHIFRYGHVNGGDSFNGAHTVNEGKHSHVFMGAASANYMLCVLDSAIRGEGFIEVVRFFTWVILNADESHLLD